MINMMITDPGHQNSVSDDQQMINMICITRQSLQKQTSSEAQNVPGIPGPSHSRLMRIMMMMRMMMVIMMVMMTIYISNF